MDALDRAAGDASLEHPLAGVTAEIGFDQGLRHTRERDRLDRQPECGREPSQRGDFAVIEAAGPLRGPARQEAVHLADRLVLVEALHHAEIVGLPFASVFLQHRKRRRLAACEPVSHLRAAGFQQVIEGASAPSLGGLWLQGRLILDNGTVHLSVPPPTEHAPFIEWVQRINDRRAARQVEAGRDATLTKAVEQDDLVVPDDTPVHDPGENAFHVCFGNRHIRCVSVS
jgi:hypothetical protein